MFYSLTSNLIGFSLYKIKNNKKSIGLQNRHSFLMFHLYRLLFKAFVCPCLFLANDAAIAIIPNPIILIVILPK